MTHFNFSVPTTHGLMDAYISSQPGPSRPGILLLPEIFGIKAAIRLAADQFARANFKVLAPDLFSQIEPRLELGSTDQDRQRASTVCHKMAAPSSNTRSPTAI